MCEKCRGTGLLPFILPDGTVSKHAKIFCDCHPVYGLDPEPEHYHLVNVEDYDFPMSADFRAFTYRYCGIPDPGYVSPVPKAVERAPFVPRPIVNVTYKVPNMDSTPYFKAIREEIKLVHGRLTKYFEDKKPRQEPQPKTQPRIYEFEK